MAPNMDNMEDFTSMNTTWLYELENITTTVGGSTESRTLDSYLWMYIAPIIFVVGLFGNIMILIVMRRKRLKGTTTSVYLPLMAIADILALIFGIIPEWLEATLFWKFKEVHPFTCKMEKFCFYTVADTSNWILVAFTLDRFIAVCFPFRKNQVCVPKRAFICCIILFCTAIVKNTHVFWTRGAEYKETDDGHWILKSNCGRPTPEYENFEFFIRPWIALVLVSLIPFLTIIVCNTFIVIALLKVTKMRKVTRTSQNDKVFMQTTAMCLGASFSFLICIAPSIVILIGRPYWHKNNPAYDVAKAINNQLVYVNHSINFCLYCLTGERFRLEFLSLFRKDQGNVASINTSSYAIPNHRTSRPNFSIREKQGKPPVDIELNEIGKKCKADELGDKEAIIGKTNTDDLHIQFSSNGKAHVTSGEDLSHLPVPCGQGGQITPSTNNTVNSQI